LIGLNAPDNHQPRPGGPLEPTQPNPRPLPPNDFAAFLEGFGRDLWEQGVFGPEGLGRVFRPQGRLANGQFDIAAGAPTLRAGSNAHYDMATNFVPDPNNVGQLLSSPNNPVNVPP